MLNKTFSVILLSSLALSACAKSNTESSKVASDTQKTTAEITDPALKQQVQQLLDKTKKELIFVKGGTYMMGDFGQKHSQDKLPYDSSTDSKPLHKVTLSDFSLSATKATYADFDIYTAVTEQSKVGKFDEFSIKERIPTIAAGVNWQQARNYCKWLGKQLNLNMDLPTEAQWEYAARNRGQYILYPTNNGKVDIGKNVWSFEQRQNLITKYKSDERIPELRQYPPTPLGFYDMITDNYEWMLDWYDPNYYNYSQEFNPQGPVTGNIRVIRSTLPTDGQTLQVFGGFTFSRKSMHPLEDPELSESPLTKKYNTDLNRHNSVRCAANP